ncbi:MAG: PASTA domain-containing protein, partial [Synergistaceae bacterium]|nr:PASTA domain-containing protein [Synergistaceae bacterium]
TVPDVNRMTESEARNLLETSGIKVQAVERVYSPLLPEGLAIETKPGAGSTLRAGQGVTLKLATQRRPAGFMDGNSASNSNSSVRRVTSQQNENQTPTPSTAQTQTQTKTANSNRGVTVSVGGQEDVIIGDNSKTEPIKTTVDTSTQKNSTPSTAKTETQAKTQTSQASSSSGGGSKTARIRYVVPPIISKPMDLRIEITDPAGKREVMNRQVKGGESINTTAKYSQECVISIYLGGEFVWQERQK